MKTLERYILTEFAKLLVMAVAAFCVLFLMIDVFESMDSLMRHNVPVIPSLLFFAYKIPFILGQTSPVAALLATLLTLGGLSRHGEITALKSGGVRLLRALVPLLVAGIALSAAVIIMNETVVPAAQRNVDLFKRQWFGMQGQGFGSAGMWMRTDRGILNVRQMDMKSNVLSGVTLYIVEKPFNVTARINAREAAWTGGAWKAPSAEVWRFSPSGAAEMKVEKDWPLPDVAPPEGLVTAESAYKNMGIFELNNYIKTLVAEGYNAARFKIDLYGKITFPLVNFIMILVGIPFALKTGRHGGIAVGIGISIIVAFSFWVVFAVMRSVGVSGAIPPLVAAVFPDVLFFAAGALMLGYVKE
ncbi:MAG: LPS export ABC transporter permease LptG [Deltaproteobacteria bacterium RIFCSPLOWO2_02_FULL_53_8]|nr:MAG: LPS export ABC transporter permease LptG [Deltaproteobacteria bacterium RIFCSPLOWO2_02_FULL_53_8]